MKECVKCFREAIFKVQPNCACREVDWACGYHLCKIVTEMAERGDAHMSRNEIIVTALKAEDVR